MTAQRMPAAAGADAHPVFPSSRDIDCYVDLARRHRSEAITAALAAAGRAVARWCGSGRGPPVGWSAATWSPSRLGQPALEGVDVEPDPVRPLAGAGEPRRHGLDAGNWRLLWWDTGRLAEARRAAQERRQIQRELMAYTDRELDDLGVRRGDIPAIARGGLPVGA